jgi:hypothetical protein
LAEDLVRAIFDIRFPDRLAALVSGSFDGAVEIDAVVGCLAVTTHFEIGRAKWNTFVIEFLGRARGIGMLPLSMVESDDGAKVFGEQVIVDATAIVTGVIANGVNLEVELVFAGGFDQTVEALEREREVALGGLTDSEVNGQVVAAGRDDMLIEGVAEVKNFAIRIPAPVGGRIGIETIVVTFEEAVFTALAGRGSVR